MAQQGYFITLEGGEGAGKTTLQTRLADRLQARGIPHLLTREPGGTDVGRSLRRLLLDPESVLDDTTELLLYAADRAEHMARKIRPALAAGHLVLCDRFTDSTVAYQGYGRGLSLDPIAQLNRIATQGLQPDVTLWLDLPVAVGLARARDRADADADRMERADMAFHERLHRGFATLARQCPHRICRIDATVPAAEVEAAAWACLGDRLPLLARQMHRC